MGSVRTGASVMTNIHPACDGTPSLRRPRVLVVEDHDLGRRSLARLLEALGYEVLAANDGQSALEALCPSSGLDYVLTDLHLPDIDGRDIVRAARQLVPAPRIALITGWDVDPDESCQMGIDWVFLKPLDVQDIVAKLQQCPPPDLAPDVD